jgi:hypothetical protein
MAILSLFQAVAGFQIETGKRKKRQRCEREDEVGHGRLAGSKESFERAA